MSSQQLPEVLPNDTIPNGAIPEASAAIQPGNRAVTASGDPTGMSSRGRPRHSHSSKTRSPAAPIKGYITRIINQSRLCHNEASRLMLEHFGVNPDPSSPIEEEVLRAANQAVLKTRRYAEALGNLCQYVDDKFQEPALRDSPLRDAYHREVQRHLAELDPQSILTEINRDIVMLDRELTDHGFPSSSKFATRHVLTPYEYESSDIESSSDLRSIDDAFDGLKRYMGTNHVLHTGTAPVAPAECRATIHRGTPPPYDSSNLNYRTVSQFTARTPTRSSDDDVWSIQQTLADELAEERRQRRLEQARSRALEERLMERQRTENVQRAEETPILDQPRPPVTAGYPTQPLPVDAVLWQTVLDMGQLLTSLREEQATVRQHLASFMHDVTERLRAADEGNACPQESVVDESEAEEERSGPPPTPQADTNIHSSYGVINFETNTKNLPKFDGTGNFRAFKNGFNTVVLGSRLPAVTKYNLLQNHLIGKANQCVSTHDDPSVAYKTTMDMLESVYGRGDTQRGLLERLRKLKFSQSFPEQMRLDLTSHHLLVQRLVATGLSVSDDRLIMGIIGKLPLSFRDKVTEFYTELGEHATATSLYQRIRKHIDSFENGLIAASMSPPQVVPVNEIPAQYAEASAFHVQEQKPTGYSLNGGFTPKTSKPIFNINEHSGSYVDPISGVTLKGYFKPGTRGVNLNRIHSTFPLSDGTASTPCAACNGSHSPVRCYLPSHAFRKALEQKGLCPNCCKSHPIEKCTSLY